MSKVILKGYIIVPDKDLEAVSKELPLHIEATKSEPGCLVFEVKQDATNKNKFEVYEEFTDKTAFEFHRDRAQTTNWGTITKDVERHYEFIE